MFTLTSSVFQNEGMIPSRYTCDEININPPLLFGGIPEGVQSFALLMDDPDIPKELKEVRGIQKFNHWVLFNIPPDTADIEEGSAPGDQGVNSRGEAMYTGPCPPTEYEPTEHRYFFKLYALDTVLTFDHEPMMEEVEEAMQGHILEEATLIGLYDRTQIK